jgi:hypothetical protein
MSDAAGDTTGGTTAVRRWRWVVAAAVTVAVVTSVVVATRLLADDEPGAAATSERCVAEVDAPFAELGAQRATWVRFCPLSDEGSTQRVRHPQGVVTGDLAASVAASLWETQADRPECIPDESAADPTGLYRIEVGLADGRVAELTGDTGCSPRDKVLFSQVETTLLMAAAGQAGPPGPLPDPITCPDRFTTTRTNADGASADQLLETTDEAWQSTVPLLPLPAAAADVCVYSGDRVRRVLVDQWQVGTPASESIRAAATTEVRRGAMTDCPTDPDALSYVVVLTDATGTARTLAIDPTVCSPLQAAIGTPPVDTYLGLATTKLVRLVRDSKAGSAG